MKSKILHYINRIKNGALTEKFSQIRWIYQYAQNHVFSILLYTLLGLSGTVVGLISSFVSKDLVDIITGHQTGKLLKTFLFMIFTQLLGVCIGQISSYISRKVSMKVENTIKADFYDQIMITDWESLSRFHSGELLGRWSGDVSVVASGILSLIPNFIISLFRLFSALAMVIHYDASFAVFAIASVPISFAVSKYNLKRMSRSNMSTLAIGTKMSSFTQESFANMQTVKAFDMIPLYSRRLRILQKEYTEATMKYQRVTSLNTIILNIVTLMVTYSTYGWGVYKVWTGAITYGTMTMFLSLSSSLTGTVQNLLNFVPNTISLTNSAKRLRWLSDLPKEDYSDKDKAAEFFNQNKECGIGLSIRNADYTYANGTEVFENVNLDAHPHEIIALVGPSGEGKTTLLRLILSIIRSKNGEGYICEGSTTPESSTSNIPLTASTRQLFAYVPQGNTMFSGTIADNMRNVKEDATDDEIIEALKIACAWEFVEKLPDGINTMMQERGGGFSEGQAQRLSIARAIIRRSPILLLDEATSALDVTTEKKVLQNIMQDQYPRTTIVTTHRPSVLSICTRVYAIRNKHCELLSQREIEELL